MLKRAETIVALALTAGLLCLHAVRMFHAGGLWRDEAAAVQLATSPAFKEVLANFQHEAFPLLFPVVIRGYARIAGDSDAAWRAFGMLVGMLIVAALWFNMVAMRRGVPLLSLALLGFNGAFLQWGDSVRGYGLGILLMLLTTGLIWRVVESPTRSRCAVAALSAVCSVQVLYYNPVLLLAVCLGAMAVTLRRGWARQTALVLGIGMTAAVSLLPYWNPLHKARDWNVLLRWPVSLQNLGVKLSEALSAPGPWSVWIWVLLALSALVVAVYGQLPRSALRLRREQRDVLLFAVTALVITGAGYFGFLKILSYPTQPWYYVALMAMVALLLDLILDGVGPHGWLRAGRLVLTLMIAGTGLLPTLRQAQVRQTNVDLIVAKLHQLADKDDLVVVTPWYNGISFQRYYNGSAAWMTVPPLGFHKFHRYDLLKSKMTLPDQTEPIRPLLDGISRALKGGHRVWVVGELGRPRPGEPVPTLSPAPDARWGWQDEAYSWMWSARTALFLQVGARRAEELSVGFDGPVYRHENLPLAMFEGWWGP